MCYIVVMKEHFLPSLGKEKRREPSVKGAQISIDMEVSLDHDEIVKRVSSALGEIEEEYGIEGYWNADQTVYAFERSGIVGEAHVGDGHVAIDIKLGVVFGAFRKVIEQKLRERLQEGLE
jgi:putative polyhydroxyalkanoate system protein